MIRSSPTSEPEQKAPTFWSRKASPAQRFFASPRVRVVSLYAPNGRSVDSEFYRAKLAWYGSLLGWLREHCKPTQPLVLGGKANQLVVQRDELDPTRSGISVSIQGALTLLADHHISGGKLGGEQYDKDAPARIQAQLY